MNYYTQEEISQIRYDAITTDVLEVSRKLAAKHGLTKTQSALEILDHKIDVVLAVQAEACKLLEEL